MKRIESFYWIGCLAIASLVVSGCASKTAPEDESSTTASPEVSIHVLVVDDPAIAATAARRWSAEGMGTANISETTLQEMRAKDFELDTEVDVIIYPSEMMVDLVSRSQIMAIPKKYLETDVVNRKEMLPHQRKYLQRFGSDVWTLPLGDTFLTLVYNKKLFAELQLDAPTTWEEYTTVAQALRKAGHRVEEPFADGWASRLFLSRAAAYVRSRGKVSTVFAMDKLTPLIAEQPFPTVLADLSSALGDTIDVNLTPKQIFQNLLNGETAMGLTWPSKHFSTAQKTSNEDLAVARIPGSEKWYNRLESDWEIRDSDTSKYMELMGCSGRVVSVNKNSRYAKIAIDFASWLCSKATSTSVSVESPNVSIYRATHLGQPARWTGDDISPVAADQYGELMQAISESQIVFLFPRIAGQSEYLESLDRAVIRYAKGESTAEETLNQSVQEWDQVTERLDRDNQKKLLRRSEGFSN